MRADLLGTPRLITTATGTVGASMAYSAYATRTGRTGTAASTIGYSGNWTDPDTGLVYLRARDYDPTSGQFLAVDPALSATRQPYAYTSNSPLGATDPTGLCGQTPTPQIHCVEPSLFEQALLTGPALLLGDLLTTGPTGEVSNFVQGIGNGATFGLTGLLRQTLTPEYACTADQSLSYAAGTAAGMVGLAVASGGVADAAGAGTLATRFPTVSKAAGKVADALKDLGGYRTGREFSLPGGIRASLGNRTADRWDARMPHYHRRVTDEDGNTIPGQTPKRHRPWEKRGPDTSFWNRF